jgi:hypothetical protein
MNDRELEWGSTLRCLDSPKSNPENKRSCIRSGSLSPHSVYTSTLCRLSSTTALTCFSRNNRNSYLEACFPLRCIQRLSLPDLATERCSWHHNSHTSGRSSPVLSY